MPPCIDCMCPSTLFYFVYLVYYMMMQYLFKQNYKLYGKVRNILFQILWKSRCHIGSTLFRFGISSFFWKITKVTTEFNLDFLHARTTYVLGGNQNEKATKSYLLNHIPPHCAQSIVTDLLNLCYCSCSCYPWHCSLIQMSCNI